MLTSEQKGLLSDEAAAGISFSNIFIAIGTFSLGLSISNPPQGGGKILIFYSSIILISGIYSSICYANTHGRLRTKDAKIFYASLPIYWGNAISEYMCLYLMNALIPVAVWAYTQDLLMTITSFAVVALFFLIYQMSGFDLLERTIKNRWIRVFLTISYLAVLYHFVINTLPNPNIAYGMMFLFPICSITLSCIHIFAGESNSNLTE